MIDNTEVIGRTANFVKEKLRNDSTGHDWWHTYRVWKMSLRLAREEKDVDMFVVQLGALLHDIADWKFNNGDDKAGLRIADQWLGSLGVSRDVISHVCDVIDNVTYRGANVKTFMGSREGMIVQDADRLDVLGAIGIARTFSYGAKNDRPMHDPSQKPVMHSTFEEYKKSKSTTVNHFYEKILLLKDMMNTQTAKEIAQERHKFVEAYLEKFLDEWEV